MNPEDMIEDAEIVDILEIKPMDDDDDEADNGPEPLTDDQIEGILAGAIDDAVDFIESDISPDRIKAQRYFDGESDIGHEDGRSKVVSTKVRDAVRSLSLIHI